MRATRYEYLQDSTFLKYFDLQRIKTQYVRIISLDWDENPIKEIEGQAIDGSVNFNGESSMRRTASINVVIKDFQDIKYYLSINKKIFLEIGFKNNTPYYTQYDKIWFPMGLFIITSSSSSHGLGNATTVSLQLKDKMCLLNGECGGTFPATVSFDKYDFIDEDGRYTSSKVTIFQIIRELVNHWGGEPLHRIIISDIDTKIKQVVKWVGMYPLYLIKDENSYIFSTDENDIDDLTEVNTYSELVTTGTYITYSYNDDVGYIYTDFTYSGGSDLIGTQGQNICNILDNIKNLLGNYEYFFDIDGNFVFQEIKNYLNTSQSKIELENISKGNYEVNQSKGKAIYNFDDSKLITSYSNTPNYNEIKNDFVIWGKKKTATGQEIPIRYHLAIDKKPVVGEHTYRVFKYVDPDDELEKAKTALEFSSSKDLPEIGVTGLFYHCMIEEEGESPHEGVLTWSEEIDEYVELEDITLTNITSTDWRTELYLNGVDAEAFGLNSNYYFTELNNEWPQLYDIWSNPQGFREEFIKNPNNCNYFLDFIDSDSEIGEFSVSNIGRRTHSEEMNGVNCIFAPEIPDLVLLEVASPDIDKKRGECQARGQKFTQVSENIFSQLTAGGTYYAAFDAIKTLLYNKTCNNANISIQCLPIYYLDVNKRIGVTDPESDIYGDYVIKSFQIPLKIDGTMSISATKAIENL